ncbi:S-layer homology domain-containing protein [Paenibacillus sp. YN15]|uniref:S-layer homology domain-containing protein n=1 Tax=Paenibacillus sp. YN15 TaxID=1742774 RepID=UPI000DCF2836|nr:S-layer homology domain-containing protein [Paenibacillus sp. YN15]RAV06437.1 hypothetical protein DQG13_00955 [Paenibacillus sp. YN15]
MRKRIGFAILFMLLAAGFLLLPAGHTAMAADDLPVVVQDNFEDEAGNGTLKDWSYPAATVTVADRPKNGETDVFEEENKALKSTVRTSGSAHRAIRKFTPLSGKVEISYEIRLDSKPISQIKLPEIQGGGANILTSISVINSLIDAENLFRFDIPTGPGTTAPRVRIDSMPLKTWIPVKVELDTDTDTFSVWVNGSQAVDNKPFYNSYQVDSIDALWYGLTASNSAAPDFYLDNLVVKGRPAPVPDVRETKLATPPQVPVAANIRKDHPRIFIDDFSKIKAKIAGDYIPMNWYNGIKRQADTLLDTPVRPYGTNPDNGQVLEHAREMENRTFILSMTYQMEREQKYLDRLWQEILNTAAYPSWKPESFLSVAEMLQAYAIAYDWNYYDWTEEQRTFILDTMLDKGLTYGVDRYNGKSQGGTNFTAVTHNWNVVCNGGLMIAALAIADEYPNLAEFVLEKGTENIKKGLTAYAPLGAYPEGAMYWSYGTSYLTYAMSALDTAFAPSFPWPDKYKLYEAPGVALAPEFPIYLSGMTGSFNYGDSNIGKVNSPIMMWFAERFDKPQYAWYFLRNQSAQEGGTTSSRGTVYALLWYDSKYRTFTGSFPLDKAYQNPTGTNSVLMRSSWQDEQGIYAGLKGGYNRENHSSLSIGTFILEALGQRWATMRGAGNYDWDNYNDLTGGRFQYYNNRAEGQNTLVMNPEKGGFDQIIEATGVVEKAGFNSGEAFGVLDMSQAYARDAASAKRGLRLFDNRSKVLVQDEITAAEPAEVWWFMHTAASIAIADDGKSAMLTQNGQRLWAHIVDGPADAVFLAMDAKPLPWSPNPAVQSTSYGTKLAIRMKGVTDARLAVQFDPLKPGEAPPSQYAPVVALADWQVEPDNTKLLGEKMGDNTALLTDSPFAYDEGARVMLEEGNPAVRPVQEGDKQLVPVSFVAESLGALVTHDESAGTDMIRYRDRLVLLPVEKSDDPTDPTESTGPESSGGPAAAAPGGTVQAGKITLVPAVNADGSALAAVTKEQLLAAMEQAAPDEHGNRKVVVEIAPDSKASSYTTELSSAVDSGDGEKLTMLVKTPVAHVEISGKLLSQNQANGASPLVLTAEAAAPGKLDSQAAAAIGERPAVRMELRRDGRPVQGNTPLPGILVSLPYTPSAHELADPEHLTIWKIAPDGKNLPVASGKYDQAAGAVTFAAHQLDNSVYSIAYVNKSFADTSSYGWAEHSISVLASKGIIQGVSESAFAPGEPVTRADFLMLLVNALELAAEPGGSFADVEENAYYAEAVGIARRLGIAEGADDNRFHPETPISRQDIFTLVARAMVLAGKLDASEARPEALTRFADSASLASYAVKSAALLAEAGMIQGDNQGIRPLDSITRAEAAVLLYRIYNK